MASNRRNKKTAEIKMKAEGLNEINNLSKETPKPENEVGSTRDGIRTHNHSTLHRTKSTIPEWRQALNRTESSIPSYYQMIRLFREIDLDSEVESAKETRWNNVLSRKFTIKKNGEVDENLTEYFEKAWFAKFQKQTLESIMWGYTLFQVGDIVNDEITDIISLKREFFNPKTNQLLERYTDMEGTSIEGNEWFFSVSPYSDLNDFQGTYAKVAPYQVNLKNTVNAYADYLRRFGTPSLVVKTEMSDEANIQHVEGYCKNFQNNSYVIVGTNDETELIEASGQGAESFNTLIQEMKASISKLIIGTGTLGEEKSFVGSANIAAEMAHLFSLNDIKLVENTFKTQLIPQLVGLGLKFLEGAELVINKEGQLTSDDKKDVLELLKTGKYEVDAEWLSDKFGMPITKIETKEDVKEDKTS